MKKSKIMMIIGALLLLSLFFFPLWNITLKAPQYPIPLGMDIWINKITGTHENDIKSINLMNHYVGMKEIPEHMSEFDIFPIVIIAMATIGVVFGFVGNRKLFLIWFIAMILIGTAGMYDFYLWEYNYGHTLDPKAAIKIPGQAYQPPLFGTKQILNFTAISLPDVGAYFMFLGMTLSLSAFFVAKKKKNSLKKNN